MNINHRPHFKTDRVEKHYSKQDGVPVKYVCTTSLGDQNWAVDVFYRETPHPEFGNRYFGLYEANSYGGVRGGAMICNADIVEELDFDMVDIKGTLHYSCHRHDYYYPTEDVFIDGGRSYLRRGGNLGYEVKHLKVKDGNFVER